MIESPRRVQWNMKMLLRLSGLRRVSLLLKRARVCVCLSVCVLCVFERGKKELVRPSVFCEMGTARASHSSVRSGAKFTDDEKEPHSI